ncbi:serine/threonine-protein kinase [Conexibacter sp. DBS9H8]|uniref:serine/threonine-protein kinase n=1 Tax=Conexibacter sp. DBS9H8 TaxID=2937801 RepID=UPI00200CCBAA|nr:serine/threonine-protein kinase [Conexibacter sp. DBS9H8]
MAQLAVGDEFAGCRVEAQIGRGGMGVVYRGTDLSLQRPVAIKLIAGDRSGDATARRRFEREARLMASIDHPNVIPVYAAGEQDGSLYLVMRYVDGVDLQQHLREHGPFAPREAARIVDQVARALDAAHARGLVHRDIKPANVLLAADHVYLSDFGITRLVQESTYTTDTGDWVGTVDFMSPEHLRGEETDARADVYSLGCVLYACLVGVPPFRRPTTAATIAGHLTERPPAPSLANPGLERSFDEVIGRALAKVPAHRYPSAGAFAAAATAAAEGQPHRWGRVSRRAAVSPGVTAQGRSGGAADRSSTAGEAPTRVAGAGEAPTRVAGAGEAPTRVAGRDQAPTLAFGSTLRSGRGRSRRRRVLAAGGLIVLAGAALGVGGVFSAPRAVPLRPLTDAEVMGVLGRFGAAVGHDDVRALVALLAPGVTRIDSVNTQHGRAAVSAEYRHQLDRAPRPVSYTLTGVVATGGWVGRAAGSYAVTLAGGTVLRGHVTFAVQEIAGRPRIGLIATQQDSVTRPSPAPRSLSRRSRTAAVSG